MPLQSRINGHLVAFKLASTLKRQRSHMMWRHGYCCLYLLARGLDWLMLLLVTDNVGRYACSVGRTLTHVSVTLITTSTAVRIGPLIMLSLEDGLQRL